MKYVLTEDGKAIQMKDGHPLVDPENGSDHYHVDAMGAADRITTLNAENKTFRKGKEKAEKSLKTFEGIDPVAAKDAIQTVSTMDDKHKADIGVLKTTMKESYDGIIAEKDKTIANQGKRLFKANVLDNFTTSEVVKKTNMTGKIAEAYFGSYFKEDGTAVDQAGNPILDKTDPTKPAKFNDALQHIINNDPDKKEYLKGSQTRGGGSNFTNDGDGNDPTPATSTENISAGLKERGVT